MRIMSGNRLQDERGISYVLGQWPNLVEGGGEGY
jgi:hypothetical protein